MTFERSNMVASDDVMPTESLPRRRPGSAPTTTFSGTGVCFKLPMRCEEISYCALPWGPGGRRDDGSAERVVAFSLSAQVGGESAETYPRLPGPGYTG